MSAYLTPGVKSLQLRLDTPTDPTTGNIRDDLIAVKVWYSTIADFDAATQGTLAFNGLSLSINIPSLTPDTLYYVRYAFISAIDPDQYTVSSTLSATPVNAVSSVIYSIITSSPVLVKNASDAATSGAYSSVTIQGKKYEGITPANYGWITVTANGATEATTATDTSSSTITLAPTDTAGTAYYTIKMYNQATVSGATLLDAQVLYVVYKGNTGGTGSAGMNAISAVISNESHVFPASNNGTVSSYSGSGTEIRVYEGATELVYDGVGTSNSTWKVTTTSTNITIGTITDSGTYATVGIHSGVAVGTDTSLITYTITGKNSLGTSFTITKTQSFSKSKTGYTPVKGTDYFDGTNGTSVAVQYSLDNITWANTPETGTKYIRTGTKVAGASDYTWATGVKFVPEKGVEYIDGVNGKNSYLHIKYSNDAGSTFTANSGEDVGTYLGSYSDLIQADSTDVTSYTWVKIKGDAGYTPVKGTDYFDGTNGTRGSRTLYSSNSAYTSTYTITGIGAGAASYASAATTLIAAAVTGSTPTTPIKGDTVTFSNGTTYVYTITYDGTNWVTPGTVIDGSLLVTGTVTAAKINSNGLSIRNAAGEVIFNAGGGSVVDFSLVGGTTKPSDNANNTYVDSNGKIQGISANAGTTVANSQITISSTTGAIGGISATGDGVVVANSQIKVGGTNFFLNSSRFTDLSYWYSNGATVSLDSTTTYAGYNTIKLSGQRYGAQHGPIARLKADTLYTVSALVKGSDSSLTGGYDNNLHIQSWTDEDPSNVHQETAVSYDNAITTSWTVIQQTFRTPPSATATYCRFYFYPLATNFVLNIAYTKLEEGNKATDWTPNPEEVRNTNISVSSSGALNGIGGGSGTVVANNQIALSSSGVLSGGASGSAVTIGGLGTTGSFGGGQIAINTDFLVSTDNIPYGYAVYNNAGISVINTVADGGALGNAKYWRIQANANGNTQFGFLFSNASTLFGGWKANTNYIVSFYAKSATLTGSFGSHWNNPPAIDIAINNPALSTVWQRYVWKINFVNNTIDANGFWSYEGSIPAGAYIDISNIQVEIGEAVSGWSPISWIDSSGKLQGVNGGTGTPVSNNNITIGSTGTLVGIGSGSGTSVSNSLVETLSVTSTGFMSVSGNTFTKSSWIGAGWNSQVYSNDSYIGGAYVRFSSIATDKALMIGLNTDPTADANYSSIDYAIFLTAAGTVQIYENGANRDIGSVAYTTSDIFSVVYDGSNIKYYKNGSVLRTVTVAITSALYLDSSFNDTGAGVTKVSFGPMTSNAWAAIGGSNKPSDNANNTYIDASGQIQGVSSNAGTTVANNQITISSTTGAIGGINSTGTGTVVANNQITINSTTGVLTGIGTTGVAVANSLLTSSIADKISKSGASVLSGTISIDAVSGAGFVASPAGNTLTWNASGQRTGGKGVAMTPGGLIGHNGTNTTFSIESNTGNVTLLGTLSSADGKFVIDLLNKTITITI